MKQNTSKTTTTLTTKRKIRPQVYPDAAGMSFLIDQITRYRTSASVIMAITADKQHNDMVISVKLMNFRNKETCSKQDTEDELKFNEKSGFDENLISILPRLQ